MILFSTILDINDRLTEERFLELVLRWNRESEHPENIVTGTDTWNGEHTIRFGHGDLSLEFEEYEDDENRILAVRHQKITADGVIWNSDFIANFSQHKLAVQLDRSYRDDKQLLDQDFSTPHFITYLIQNGYLADDGRLPVLREPVLIDAQSDTLMESIMKQEQEEHLPIVTILPVNETEYPVNIHLLASRLKGVAHVFVQQNTESSGSATIYYPSGSMPVKRFLYRGDNEALLQRIVKHVISYSNLKNIPELYTWDGVINALLKKSLRTQILKQQEAESEKEELYDVFDEDLQKLQRQVEELTRSNQALHAENQGLRRKFMQSEQPKALQMGEEDELYPGEIEDCLLEILSETLTNTDEKTRRAHILQDLLKHNDYQRLSEQRKQEVKTLFKGYKSMSATMRQALQKLGFEISEDGAHYKLTYGGDSRYRTTIAKTGSDHREGKNIAAVIGKMMP